MVEKLQQGRLENKERRNTASERLFSRLFSARELKSLDRGVDRKQMILQELRNAYLDLDDRAKTITAFKALRLWGVRVNGYQKRKKLYGEFFPNNKNYRGQDGQNRELIRALAEKLGLSEKIETAGASSYFYELGKYEGADFRLKEGFSLSKIEGSVDSTWHYESWNSIRWYRDKITAARLMKNVYDQGGFDAKTRALITDIYEPLAFLATQNPIGFKRGTILRAFKNRRKYPREKVYGTRGMYNLILGWQRILDAFGNTTDPEKAWKNLGSAFDQNANWEKSLTIKVGPKVNNRLLRHVRVHVEKANEEEEGGDEDNDEGKDLETKAGSADTAGGGRGAGKKPLPRIGEVLAPKKVKTLSADAPVVSDALVKLWEGKAASLNKQITGLITDAQTAFNQLGEGLDQAAKRSLQSLIATLEDTRRYLATKPTTRPIAPATKPATMPAKPASQPTSRKVKTSSTPEIPATGTAFDQFEDAFDGLEKWLKTMKTALSGNARYIKNQLPILLEEAKKLATMVRDHFNKEQKTPTSLPIVTTRPVVKKPTSAPVLSIDLVKFWEGKTAFLNEKVADLIADANEALNDFSSGVDQEAKRSLQSLITMLKDTSRYLATKPAPTSPTTKVTATTKSTTRKAVKELPETMPAVPRETEIPVTGAAFDQLETAFSGLEKWLKTMKTALSGNARYIKNQLPALLEKAQKLAKMVRENFENEKVRTSVLLQIVKKAPVQQAGDKFILPLGKLYGSFVLEKDEDVWKLVFERSPYLPVEIPAAVFEAAGEKLRTQAKKTLKIKVPELTVPQEYMPKPKPQQPPKAEEKSPWEELAEQAKKTMQELQARYLREEFNKSPQEDKWHHKGGGIILEKKGEKTWSVLVYTHLGTGGSQLGVRENFTDLEDALKAVGSITKIFEANKKHLLDLKSDNTITDRKPPYYIPWKLNKLKGAGDYLVMKSGALLDYDTVISDFPLPKKWSEKQKWLRLANAYALREPEAVMLKSKIEKILGEHKDSVKIVGLEGRPVRKIILQSAGKKLTLWNSSLAPRNERRWRVVETGTRIHTMEGAVNYAIVYGLISTAFNNKIGSLDEDELTFLQQAILIKAKSLSDVIDPTANLASVLADYNRVVAQSEKAKK